MKKLIILVILLITVMSCELFDAALWEKARKERRERGEVCERDGTGYYYCYDRY